MSEEVQTPQEPTPQEPVNEAISVIGDDGKLTEAFRNSLPDDLGKHSIFDKYGGDLTSMIKGTINAQELVGKKAEEFWQSDDPSIMEARKKIQGVPEDLSEYTYDMPELPDTIDKEKIGEFTKSAKEKFAELGINKDQAKALIEWDLNNLKDTEEQQRLAYEEQRDAGIAALKQEWKGDKYEYNVSKVQDVMAHLKADKFFNDPVIANNPEFIKWAMEEIVPLVDNDTLIQQRQTESLATLSDQLTDIESQIYKHNDPRSSDYMMLVKKRTELLQKIPK